MAKKDLMQKEMSKAYKTGDKAGKKMEVAKVESKGMKKAMAKKKK